MKTYFSKIESAVSGDYVSPLYPKTNEDLKISIRINEFVSSVVLFINIDGVENRLSATIENNRAFVTTKLRNGLTSLYYFSLIIDGKYYYYSKSGVTAYVPSYKSYFEITPDISPSSWGSLPVSCNIWLKRIPSPRDRTRGNTCP